jgi:hypothetical protein
MRRGHVSTLPVDLRDPKAKDRSFRANWILRIAANEVIETRHFFTAVQNVRFWHLVTVSLVPIVVAFGVIADIGSTFVMSAFDPKRTLATAFWCDAQFDLHW